MFAKLKKKIAEETATTSWPGGAARMPRSVSKESVTSVGVDSGDDFPSDGSSSREDPSSQLFRRNEQVRKLEIKLSDYAEQVRNLQKIKEKLENALETHQDSFVKKLQEQNEAHQASLAKNVEEMASALENKDQEWKEKLSHLEKERKLLSAQLQEMREQSLNLFQKRDELDELEGFQQQELAKVKHMLLQKEESLVRAEQGLASSAEELARAQEAFQLSQAASSRLSGELQELKQQHAALQAERDELLKVEENAEKKITALELRGQELQTYTQRLSVDLQNAQVTTSGCEKRLEVLQEEHGSLKVEYEQHKQKMALALEERTRLVGHLQEKVATLEKRLEGNLSGDDHVGELIREKSALEERLEATRHQLSVAQSSHTERLSFLETQQKDLERALRLAQDTAAKSKEDVEGRERQIQELQSGLALERTQWQERVSSVEHQRTEHAARLEEQVASLESEREAAQHKMRQLEKENGELKERCRDLEGSLKSEQERLKAELSSALGETQKQKEGLQHQVATLALSLKEKELLLAEKTAALLTEEEEVKHLRQGRDAVLLQMQHLQSSLELCQGQASQREAAAEEQRMALQAQLKETQERLAAHEKQVATLELASKALGGKPLCPPPGEGEGEPNGEVAPRDVVQLQKEKRSLEQQLAEKNKIIKQLQQRMAELKKTLQKELKIRPDGEIPEVPGAALTVTNNSDLNDSREINFEYLKHVVLKFMSCREAEAFHLIKAVSVLLNFSTEEENMLKETLEYKMSWFGSKPPPRGSIRPSISSPRSAW